ncbi:Protein of unknown function, partial [Gryllus bimaculatus]
SWDVAARSEDRGAARRTNLSQRDGGESNRVCDNRFL